MSQKYLISAVEFKFRGQAILFTPVIVHNTEHHEYPKYGFLTFQIWVRLVKGIVSTMPERYQDNEWVKEHMEDPEKLQKTHKQCSLYYQFNIRSKCFLNLN